MPLPDAGLTARNGLTVADARRMTAALGIAADLGHEFPCLLADDPDRLAVVDPESLRYQLLYRSDELKSWWSLAEVCASTVAGHPVDLGAFSGVRHARWWDRLRYQAGLLDVHRRPLAIPDRASPAARRVAAGFELAYVLNALHHGDAPFAFSQRYAAEWCGLPVKVAAQAVRELVALGVLVIDGQLPTRPRPTPLYVPTIAVPATPTMSPLEAFAS